MSNLEATTILPYGDPDSDAIYIAVGKSIHRWESLEWALARLYLKFAAIPDLPANYLIFGQENSTFAKRMTALAGAAEVYFVKQPDQHKQRILLEVVEQAHILSMDRHLIAHGHIAMWAEVKKGTAPFATATKSFSRWAPPFYWMQKPRSRSMGLNAEAIDAVSQQFEELHNRAHALAEAL
jgi:hypothetical protein